MFVLQEKKAYHQFVESAHELVGDITSDDPDVGNPRRRTIYQPYPESVRIGGFG